jgi:endonuclease/exonuclease/phosphatase family metal-dependent hydrolase
MSHPTLVPLRFLTWNVNWTGALKRNYTSGILEFIDEYNPDIMCLQEVTEDFTISGYHTLFCVETHAGYVAMFSKIKYPVKFTQITTGGIVELNDTITIAGCHLIPYFNNEPVRIHQLTNVLIKNSFDNALIFGDFNWTGDISFPGFTDCGKVGNMYTFDSTYHDDKHKSKARYDRVISKGNVTVSKYKVHKEVYLSDHFPITFDVRILSELE